MYSLVHLMMRSDGLHGGLALRYPSRDYGVPGTGHDHADTLLGTSGEDLIEAGGKRIGNLIIEIGLITKSSVRA